MKIDFSNVNKDSFAGASISTSTNEYSSAMPHSVNAAGAGFRLDISGRVKDNAASGLYGKNGMEKVQGRTINDCLQGMSGIDMSVQHNYMAVMSNSLSAKDFSELREEGFHPGSMQPDELVTVTDQIKMTLAEGGKVIEGYNDNMDSEVIKAASDGNISRVMRIEQAFKNNDMPATEENVNAALDALKMSDEMAENLEGGCLSDESIAYLLSTDSDITLENAYMSQFRAQNMPTAALTAEQLEQLRGQFEGVISASGYEINEDTLADARWIIEHQLPLTADMLKAYEEIKDITFPLAEKELLDDISEAIYEGKKATEVSLIKKERVLAETRLSMTAEANLRLLKSEYYIDTTELEQQVEELKNTEKSLESKAGSEINTDEAKGLIPRSADPVEYFEKAQSAVKDIRQIPVDVVADFTDVTEYSLKDVLDKGSSLKAMYEKAGESYEALRTEVRADLGDNIKKAFANVDSLLEEQGLEPSESNKRAVRILGYNRMEINDENIAKVKEADSKISAVIDALKPAAVMKLIREGRNPLSMDVDELEQTLKQYEIETDASDERYSKYLWKLMKNNQIEADERESYIGIYRLFRQVEKSDGAVIGSLLNQGAELTVKNLLSAVRSKKAAVKGVDYTVDDEFGALEAKLSIDNLTIDAQIGSSFQSQDYYERKNSDVLDTLDPGRLQRALSEGAFNAATTLEETADMMSQAEETEADIKMEEAYNEQQAENIRSAMRTEEDVLRSLQAFQLPVTAEYVDAFRGILFQRGDVFKKLARLGKQLEIEELIEDFDTPDGIQAALDDLMGEAQEKVEAELEKSDMTYDKYEDLKLMSRQIHMFGVMQRQQSYEIPMEIDGELTSVNLTIKSGSKAAAVQVTFETDGLGTLSVQMKLADNKIDGLMLTNTYEGEEYLNERLEIFIGELSAEGIGVKDSFQVVRRTGLSSASMIAEAAFESQGADVDNTKLYSLAKLFLRIMR